MKTCTIEGCERQHRARGYCAAHYNKILAPDRHRTLITCAECGAEHETTRTNGRYCSLECRDAKARRAREARPSRATTPRDLRSPLRRAIEDSDYPTVLTLIAAQSTATTTGCHEWSGRVDRHGYPVARIGGREYLVHRLVVEATLGAPLGTQHAHHKCANTACVNPEHLQPVTHRENGAEMHARTYMVRRIDELERALAALAPAHPLLREIGLPKTA